MENKEKLLKKGEVMLERNKNVVKGKVVNLELKKLEIITQVKTFGNACHIILPRMLKGKFVNVKIKEIPKEKVFLTTLD
jgi:hypothetical protein